MHVTPSWSRRPTAIGALEGAAVGAVAYYVALAVAAVAQGRPLAYPFRAVLAMFRGNRALPDIGPAFDDTGWVAYVRGAGWILLLSLLCAGTFLVVARYVTRRVASPYAVVAVGVLWSLLWLGVTLLLLDHPRPPGIRRQVLSLGGLHELGITAFVAAHLAFGVTLGALSVRPRRERSRQNVAAVPGRAGTW
jgi:hypothetical protein